MLDPTLVPLEIVEELAVSEDHAKRMSAAMILWDHAVIAPADVPVGLLGRLALPSIEDWYVQAPAMAATKQLLLKRREARIIFDGLTASPDSEDRYAVAQALVDVCRINRSAVPRELAERLATDADELVAAKGQELLRMLGDGGDDERPVQPIWIVEVAFLRCSATTARYRGRPKDANSDRMFLSARRDRRPGDYEPLTKSGVEQMVLLLGYRAPIGVRTRQRPGDAYRCFVLAESWAVQQSWRGR